MRDINAIVVGDVIVDRYYEGDVNRISPEAPCPVVDVYEYIEVPGGAANVAQNLAGLGVTCDLITVLGGREDDEGAMFFRAWFEDDKFVRSHAFHLESFRTPIKTRVCTPNGQQLIRFDIQDDRPFSDASANNAIWQRLEEILRKAHRNGKPTVLVLSDYGKGVLRDKDLVHGILDVAQVLHIPTIVDPKDRNLARYSPAMLLKPNLKEAMEASGGTTAEDCASRIMQALRPGVKGVLVTAGAEGMVLATANDRDIKLSVIPTYTPQLIGNTVGAGDTVTAVLALELAASVDEYANVPYSFHPAVKRASIAAGVVVGKAGTAIINSWEYEEALAEHCVIPVMKSADVDAMLVVLEDARKNGETIVMVNGCFDQLHPGHLHLLQEARRMGELLVVAVNSDDSVTRLKGANRPLVPCEQRVKMLEALSCVDLVVVFEEDTPEKLIRMLRPDLLVKGDEYYTDDLSQIPGASFVVQNGKGIAFVKMLDGFSTTRQALKAKDVFGEG